MFNLDAYEGCKFCVVFVKVLDEKTQRFQVQTLHGRADVGRGKLSVVGDGGVAFTVPHTALRNILANDGTDILKDCEYYVMVKTDAAIQLEKPDWLP